ncbi:DUF1205 domain-containing protein [Silvimonas sp. JCM 19000]
MSRILFAWELGDNHGHLWRLLPIALAARAQGHDISFALRAMRSAQRYLTPRSVPFVACPNPYDVPALGRDPSTYADVLALNGATDVDLLGGMVRGWRQLYRLVQPDVVVIDHAPTALMASRVAGIRSVQIGTGFAIPPSLMPAPCYRAWDSDIEARQHTQAAVEHAVASVCEMPLSTALQADHTRLLSLPELDHYATVRPAGALFLGGMPQPPAGQAVQWHTDKTHILVYLQSGDWLGTVLEGLVNSEAEVIAVVPGIALAQAAQFPELRIYPQPVQLEPLLPRCDLIISHGGHGTALNALRAGVPLLMLPQHMEQLLVTERVAVAGAGLGVFPTHIESSFEHVLFTLLMSPQYRAAAQQVATRYAEWRDEFALQQMLAVLNTACAEAA